MVRGGRGKGKSSTGNYKIWANCLILIDLMYCNVRIWRPHKIGGPVPLNRSHTRRDGRDKYKGIL